MKTRFLSVIAATLLLAACESAPEQQAAPMVPAGAAPGSIQDFVENVGERVFFATDESKLDDVARVTLDKQAAWLKKYPGYNIVIEGNCDERGTREYNLALGERRAKAVKDYLVSNGGMQADRLGTVSFGKERPIALGSTPAAWAKNRNGTTALSK